MDKKAQKDKERYQHGKIYSIRSHQTDDVYIGSTINTLPKRLDGHRKDFKRWINGNKNYVSSYDIIKFDDCYIELIENYPCSDKNELDRQEGIHIRNTNCINKNIAGRTMKEYYIDQRDVILQQQKEHYADHRDVILQQKKEYYADHRDERLQQQKEYRNKNKELISQRTKARYIKNKELVSQKNKAQYQKKKEIISQQAKARRHAKKLSQSNNQPIV